MSSTTYTQKFISPSITPAKKLDAACISAAGDGGILLDPAYYAAAQDEGGFIDEQGEKLRPHSIATINALAEAVRSKYRHVVVLGTGGSSLCPNVFLSVLQPYRSGYPGGQAQSLAARDIPQLHVCESIDPQSFYGLLRSLPLEETLFLTISKSGNTVETMSQMRVICTMLEGKLGKERVKQHVMCISDPAQDAPSALRHIASTYGLQVEEHSAQIGGRFSLFTNVGLLPAAIAGLDIGKISGGARAVLQDFVDKRAESAPALGAAWHHAMADKVSTTVLFYYGDRYDGLAQWWRQIWAESLGKDGFAVMPICAQGPIDQHSQQQQYLGGNPASAYSFLSAPRHGDSHAIGQSEGDAPQVLQDIAANSMGDILSASHKATMETFADNGLNVRDISAGGDIETEIGALAMHFLLEVMVVAHLRGINPFGQPAVEEGKKRLRDIIADADAS